MGHEVSETESGIEIKQDDEFFTRIMSKETSMANSSCRIYYGGASGAIPFMWESTPGTPKHTFADTSIPPLAPPPSYHSITPKKNNKYSTHNKNMMIKPSLLTSILLRLAPGRSRSRMSPAASASSSLPSRSTWSSFHSSVSTYKEAKSRKRCYWFPCTTPPVLCYRSGGEDDDNDGPAAAFRIRSPATLTSCYDFKDSLFECDLKGFSKGVSYKCGTLSEPRGREDPESCLKSGSQSISDLLGKLGKREFTISGEISLVEDSLVVWGVGGLCDDNDPDYSDYTSIIPNSQVKGISDHSTSQSNSMTLFC